AVAGAALVDPIPDIRALERTSLHGRDDDLPAEVAVGEDPEAGTGAELPLALAGAAAHGEGIGVLDDVGLAGDVRRLPLRQPGLAGTPHLAPSWEVRRDHRTEHDAATELRAHRRISPSAPSSRLTLARRAVWTMQPMRH